MKEDIFCNRIVKASGRQEVESMNIRDKKFHFIAAGGAGMSALACILSSMGAEVSGSDIQESKYTHLLEDSGVHVHIGHSAGLIKENMIIAASTAVKKDNPEIMRAAELGLKIYHRSDILKMISDEFSNNSNSLFIGFSGAHGKTTTSGLCAYLLEKAGFYPSYAIGGVIPDINTNGKYSGDKYFIAELDESDGTIQKYSTDIAVINNIEEDHLDYYKNGFPDIAETFNKYLSNKPSQKVIINNDNNGCREFMKLYPAYNYITFGLNEADYTAQNVKIEGLASSFGVYKRGKKLSDIHPAVPGLHNVYNALAVSAALTEAGIDINELKEHFAAFSGMGRRFQKIGTVNGVTVYDDYAHHPQEIKASLKTLKDGINGRGKVIAVFQPHRFTRLKNLWNDFKKAFDNADMLFVLDVYSAGEKPEDGITAENFVKDLNRENIFYIKGSIKEAASKIAPYLQTGSYVMTLGAGDVTNLGRYLIESLND